ncbi:hypothetical protein OH77DRAFT_793361 [Trametes cingulata]|nr:hypothetical protein OH77DRAFT_793361 [Trametes cingulata]
MSDRSPFAKCIKAFEYQDPLPPVQRTEQEEVLSAMVEDWITADQAQVAWRGFMRDYLPDESERTSPEELATRQEFADKLYDNLRIRVPGFYYSDEKSDADDASCADLSADECSCSDCNPESDDSSEDSGWESEPVTSSCELSSSSESDDNEDIDFAVSDSSADDVSAGDLSGQRLVAVAAGGRLPRPSRMLPSDW